MSLSSSKSKFQTSSNKSIIMPEIAKKRSSIGSARNGVTRLTWSKSLEFILACMGYAIGLGNVWRFPYLAYRNGGGAFLIPFFIMVIFIGLPLFFLELYVGQYTGLGPIKAFAAIGPFFSGLGVCTIMVMTLICVYYMVIVAWILFYVIVSIAGQLNWGLCDNTFNTDNCFSGQYDTDCRLNNNNTVDDLTYFHRNCVSIKSICTEKELDVLNATHCLNGTTPELWYKGISRILAAEEYYNENVLGKGNATWDDFGDIQWHLVGTLFLSWIIVYVCVNQGVQLMGKVVYFTALFPHIMLTALFIRGVTLKGAQEGLKFYLLPDWKALRKSAIWGDAASQVFYSFGVACGSLVTLASYNDFYNNSYNDAVFVSLANFLTSCYAGFAIFSILGFQAFNMGVSVEDIVESGPGLAFVAYPEAILQMPLPIFWSIMFFSMMFIMGIGSQLAGIVAIKIAIMDYWPDLRGEWKVSAYICCVLFLLGIPMCRSGGVYLLTVVDWNTASWSVLIIGVAECLAVSWSYGVNRAMRDLARMNMTFGPFMTIFWKVVWSFIVPVGSIGILVFVVTHWTKAYYEKYVFPWSADVLGWMIGFSTLAPFPICLVYTCLEGNRCKELFTPTRAWKPSVRASLPVPRLAANRSEKGAQDIDNSNFRYVM